MASFQINLANNGAGVFTPAVIRGGTPASGGTVVTLPAIENNLNGASTSSKLLGTAIWMAYNGMFNNISQTPANNNSAWYITIADDGSQNYTPTVRFGGTPASGGTALTIPWVVNNLNGASTTSDLKSALLRVTSDAIFNSTSTNGV
jgi:hypothetical protein